MPADIDALRSSVSWPPMISVSIGPGASTFTVIPYGPSSRAAPLHIPITAALAVAYTPFENVPPPSNAVIEDVLTMRPTPCWIILGARSEERRVGKERRSRWSPYH